MKSHVLFRAVLALLATAFASQAQPILSVDFNRRPGDISHTHPGFQPFVIDSIGGDTLNQTGAVTRAFGEMTVTVTGVGSNPGYTDRLRSGPANSGDFSQTLLLRDFVYSVDTGSGGLNINVTGLPGSQYMKVTIWSFDQTSVNTRASDWRANGFPARLGYTFDGAVPPASDTDYQFSFKTLTTGFGEIAIQGRRVSPTPGNQPAVFINALQIEPAEPDAPENVTLGSPLGSTEVYVGDNLLLAAQHGGTAPFTYHWFREATPLGVTTTNSLWIKNAQLTDGVGYSVVVSNSTGTAASEPVAVTIRTVDNLSSGLVAYWPLDLLAEPTVEIGQHTPDLGPSALHLLPTTSGESIFVPGQRGNAASFNGVDRYYFRTNQPGESLPAVAYPAYTVALWVKGDGTTQQDKRVFVEGSNLSNNPLLTIGTDNAASSPTNTGVDVFVRFGNGGNPINHRKTTLAAFDGEWHHIAWVDNNGFATVYVDGVADTNNFHYLRSPLAANIESVGVVYRGTNSTAFFNGLIDDVAIWRRALSPEEIAVAKANGPFLQTSRLLQVTTDATTVQVTFTSSSPSGTHVIEQATDLATTPVVWTEVNGATFSVAGNQVTAQFPRPGSSQAFFRVRQ